MILPRAFYDRPCLEVAPALLGKYLVRRHGRHAVAGRIVEVEAYVHEEDRACHAWRGPTARARVLYAAPGTAYVFLIYGMHSCMNAVCEPEGSPAAVLIRALEPVPPLSLRTDGPGLLCRALGITRKDNELDLTRGRSLWIEDRGEPAVDAVTTPRIGVDYAGEWAKKPWRFVDASSEWLSRKLKRTTR